VLRRSPEGRLLVDQVSESEQRWRLTMEHSPVGMTLVGQGGELLVANRAFREMLGYPEDVLRTMTFQEITHPEDLAADLALLEETLAGGRSSYRIRKRYIHADGHLVWGDLSVALLRSEGVLPRACPRSPPLIEQVALRPCRDPRSPGLSATPISKPLGVET
jgi:hypothetical protein